MMMFMNEENKAAAEAVLFAMAEPVTYRQLADWLKMTPGEVRLLLEEMQKDYQIAGRGIELILETNSCRLGTKPQYTALLMQVQKIPVRRLSMAALETLAIVAYRQPITRPQIDEIRGIKSERVVQSLLERGLVAEEGHLDVPGRPALYVTTPQFLEQFSLKSLEELPPLEG